MGNVECLYTQMKQSGHIHQLLHLELIVPIGGLNQDIPPVCNIVLCNPDEEGGASVYQGEERSKIILCEEAWR